MKFNIGDRIKSLVFLVVELMEPCGIVSRNTLEYHKEYLVNYINEEMGYYLVVEEGGPGGQINFIDEDKFELV